jgi:hypothetical protein
MDWASLWAWEVAMMVEQRLEGGNTGGAVRVCDTVRRAAGPWTPAVHALLAHLAGRGFTACPRPLGIDARGREILTFLPGQTVGSARPWPGWAYAQDTLVQAARWLRSYHTAAADFVPPEGAVWRLGGHWRPGLVIGHNDAAPYNAVWRSSALVGFIDWDMAGPVPREWDVAFMAFGWVPLHAEEAAAAEGFTDFASRPARLRRFLAAYGWDGTMTEFLDVLRARLSAHITAIRTLAAAGDPVFTRLAGQGIPDDLDTALTELDHLHLDHQHGARM